MFADCAKVVEEEVDAIERACPQQRENWPLHNLVRFEVAAIGIA